jgi:hypothetical protein
MMDRIIREVEADPYHREALEQLRMTTHASNADAICAAMDKIVRMLPIAASSRTRLGLDELARGAGTSVRVHRQHDAFARDRAKARARVGRALGARKDVTDVEAMVGDACRVAREEGFARRATRSWSAPACRSARRAPPTSCASRRYRP